jgi:putative oxidoreductase
MVHDGLPTPVLATAIGIVMELPVAFSIAIGAFTRAAAVLMFLYTLGTSLVEHRYWMLPAGDRLESMEGFYKNLSIMGGFLLLFVTGAGKLSIDALFGVLAP